MRKPDVGRCFNWHTAGLRGMPERVRLSEGLGRSASK
jgi:hypothetical protein